MIESPAVDFVVHADVGVVTLHRPDNRNSMTPELLDAFSVAVAAAARAPIRCLVITGTGTCFSSGADFKSMPRGASPPAPPAEPAGSPPPVASLRSSPLQRAEGASPHERSYAMYEPFLALLDIAVPVIGALNGHAVGGGFGLALVCDMRIGARDAKYGANFTRLGLAPGMAISYLLPRLVGLPRANELLLTGRLVDGAEAERLGILNRAVPTADVLPQAMALAQEIAGNAPFAVRATKRAIQRGLELHVREAARVEAYAQAESLAMDDAKEGIAALLAKRPPKFTGR